MEESIKSFCTLSEAEEQNQGRTAEAARTHRTLQQNGSFESNTVHQNQTEPEVRLRGQDQRTTSESEHHHTDPSKCRRHKRHRNQQASGGAETEAADHLTHTASNQHQRKLNQKPSNASTATPPLIDHATAPEDGGEKQKRRRKKKQSRRNTEDNAVKACESGAVENRTTPLKYLKTQGIERFTSCVMSSTWLEPVISGNGEWCSPL